jgi:hypothetical protein
LSVNLGLTRGHGSLLLGPLNRIGAQGAPSM